MVVRKITPALGSWFYFSVSHFSVANAHSVPVRSIAPIYLIPAIATVNSQIVASSLAALVGSSKRAQFAVEPGFGRSPIPLDGDGRDFQQQRDFLHRQPPEES